MNRAGILGARVRAGWAALAPREQRMVAIAAALVGLAVLWWVLLAPALRTLAAASAEHASLDAQIQQMTALQAQARALQSQPRANPDDALRALENSVREQLGAQAQMQGSGAGEGVTVALRAVPAEVLAQWLAQARGNARAVPREVHLTRATAPGAAPPSSSSSSSSSPAPAPAPAQDDAGARWDGTVIMSLPAR